MFFSPDNDSDRTVNEAMIPLFNKIINLLSQKELAPYQRYKAAYEGIVLTDALDKLSTIACPPNEKQKKCGAVGGLKCHSKYRRAGIRDIVNDEIIEYEDVEISRVICYQCLTTHALLLWFIPPYSRHTLRFVLTVLQTYYQKTLTIEALCAKYDITHPTLYAWAARYHDQSDELRVLFDPPLLPDGPLEFEQWENGTGAAQQPQSTQSTPPMPTTKTGTDKEDFTTVPAMPVYKSDAICTQASMSAAFDKAVFMAIKAAIEQDNTVLFAGYYAAHRTVFFQTRQIRTGASRARARTRSP